MWNSSGVPSCIVTVLAPAIRPRYCPSFIIFSSELVVGMRRCGFMMRRSAIMFKVRTGFPAGSFAYSVFSAGTKIVVLFMASGSSCASFRSDTRSSMVCPGSPTMLPDPTR